MHKIHIDKAFSGWVEAMGVRTFSEFMHKPVIHNGQKRKFYLKRIGREPFIKLFQSLMFGRFPQSGPVREKQMLSSLNAAGIATMRPVAFGERRCLGWPIGGFLLVEEVCGTEVADFYRSCGSEKRLELVEELGRYLGRLHEAGFFQPVRLKDLFFRLDSEGKFAFVLIDRETSKPWPSHFRKGRCLQTLVRASRRTLRDGYVIGRKEVRAFCRGYQRVVGKRLGLTVRALQEELLMAYRRELLRADRRTLAEN
jgi:tRNA A-37 threonylcarbamoyl transferase component Bud32